ncbi:unnamed protein product, partial [Pylaiella littoralis]
MSCASDMLLGMEHGPRAFGIAPLFLALATRPLPWADAFTGRTAAVSSRACTSGGGSSARGSAAFKKPACPTGRVQAREGEETVMLAWECWPKSSDGCRPRPRSLYA